jgi:ribonucleoside-diphosphate reductase alpha chain
MVYAEEEVEKATLEYFNGDDLATNVWVTKYALKNKKGELLEKTPDDMHKRLAKEFARVEKKFGGSRKLSEEEIYKLFKDFKYVVPQGSPMMGVGNDHVNVSLSNCVVVASPEDNISSIVDSGKELANLFKRRCGVGVDVSNLRPDGTAVNNSAGTTTGAWSFADFYSYICRMIGQNGRRGALMITMDVRHPDIEQFVTMKHDLRKVTGANISVKISDEFMKAVENKHAFTLQFPVGSDSPTITKEIQAEELWETIVESATKTAEPGLMMWDNITKELPAECYADAGFKTLTTNPCGEIPLSAYDSCRLISINLKNFVVNPFKNSKFDFLKLSNVATQAMRLSDDLVELEIEKLEKIIKTCDTRDEKALWKNLLKACQNGRRTGLGTHGLADAIACLNLRYDSEDAIKIIEKIYETIRNAAYTESVDLAKERGTFPVFDWPTEKSNSYISRLPKILRDKISRFGRRNISILTNAPTGSVSIMSQTSSGLEPVFRNFYIRRRKLSHNEQDVNPDYVDELGDQWLEYKVFHHNVKNWLEVIGSSRTNSSDSLPEFFVTSDQIDWKRRIAVQAAIQRNIDHSISSTINLPKGTEPEVVAELYFLAWKLGLKGVTVYVDGSRSGVLVTDSERSGEPFPQNLAPDRPEELECDIHHTTIQGEKWTILVGKLDEKPYEVMGGLSNLIEIPKRHTQGHLSKTKFKTRNNRYDLRFGDNGDEVLIRDIVKVFDNPNNSAFTRIISLALRHGSKPSFLVEQLQKDKDSDLFSFSRCIARILKSYIKNGEKVYSDKICPDCSTEIGLIYQDGCVTCQSCGYAKCG